MYEEEVSENGNRSNEGRESSRNNSLLGGWPSNETEVYMHAVERWEENGAK